MISDGLASWVWLKTARIVGGSNELDTLFC